MTQMETVHSKSQNPDAASVSIIPNLKSLYLIGGVAAILQLVVILAMAVATATLGPKPASAKNILRSSKAAS